jgi:hypothetical protein
MAPIKICKEEAEIIIDSVRRHSQSETHRISKVIAAELRQMAIDDEQEHASMDPEYNSGGGPANLINRIEPKVEERQRTVGEWPESWREMFGGQSSSTRQERLG